MPAAPLASIHDLTQEQRHLLVLLALTEPLNITALTELASAAGLRQSARLAHTTSSLRATLQPLHARRLLTSEPAFCCQGEVRSLALRHAASTGELIALLPAARAWAQRRFSVYGTERTVLEARAGLYQRSPGADELLSHAASVAPNAVQELCLEALCRPFDPRELVRLSPNLRAMTLAILLPFAEATGVELGELYAHLAADPTPLEVDELLVAAFAGVAVNRGDADTVRHLAERPATASLRPALVAAAAVIEGDFAAARAALDPQGKRSRTYPGVLGLLQGLVLVRDADLHVVEQIRRTANAGIKSSRHLGTAFASLKRLAAAAGPAGSTNDAIAAMLRGTKIVDLWAPLVDALTLLWFGTKTYGFDLAALVLERTRRHFALPAGAPWLYAQSSHAIHELAAREPSLAQAPSVRQIPRPEGPFLGQLKAVRPAWERSLEQLVHVLPKLPGRSTAAAAEPEEAQRLLWRLGPYLSGLEPYLQKRSRGDWTRGRKLAVQHLLPGRPLLAQLPPEDRRVAAFARESRSVSHGYASVEYYVSIGAFAALVGHPRVYVEDDDQPVEVIAGTVHVLAHRKGSGLRLTVEPADLRDPITVKREGARLVVYSLSNEAKAIVDALRQSLVIPSEGKARALEVLERIAHVLPVQSAEQTAAQRVEADARPCFRLLPRARGLAISLGTRPLGEGPRFVPGEGAATVLGKRGGEAVQTERELALERRNAARAVAACASLAGSETGEHEWRLEEPEDCLALVAELRALGEEVHVEWPEGKPLRVRARLPRSALGGRLTRRGGQFLIEASLAVDDELSLDLEALLALVAERPERFVRLESGEYLELETELRDTLEALASARVEPRAKASGKSSGKTGGVALAPSALPVLDRLTTEGSGFTLDRDANAWRERVDQAFARKLPVPRALEAELRPYQLEGFRWLARLSELELGACLADDMGVGKTVQLIALLLHRAKLGPALVVAPTSVCDNWQRELGRFAPSLEVLTYWGPDRGPELERLGPRRVLLTSYAILQQDVEALRELAWATAILDEAQLIKNQETQRAQAAYSLQASARVVATGTPVENHLGDLHALFRFLMPELLGTWPAFCRRFGVGKGDGAGASGPRALKRLLRPFVLRRTRSEVLDELPPLTEIEHRVPLSAGEARLYEAVRRAAVQKLAQSGQDPRARVQVLAEITRLRRLCCHPSLVAPEAGLASSKLASFLELMEELREGRHRALVFSQFVDVLTLARELLDARDFTYQYLDGATPQGKRAAAVEAFQAGEGDAFLISLKAGGFGLNLTGADYVIHLDPWWNPAVEAQASGRAHRIGQSRPVTVYRLVTEGTVEAKIVELHRQKRELAESLLDGTDQATTLGVEELRELLAPGA